MQEGCVEADRCPLTRPTPGGYSLAVRAKNGNPSYILEFEKPLRDLARQLDELRQQSVETNVDVAKEIRVDREEDREDAARDLLQPDTLAEGAPRPPSQAALRARLRGADLPGVPGAARRPPVQRRPRARGRDRLPRRPGGHDRRAAEGARSQGEDRPQLRDAAARGVPKGAADHEDGGEVRPARPFIHRHAGGVPRRSDRRSATSRRRSPSTSARWRC